MDPFHVVALAGTQARPVPPTCPTADLRASGRTGDPLYGVRRALRTRLPLLTSRQQSRLTTVFADDAPLAVLVTRSIYQRIIPYYHQADRRRSKTMLTNIINTLR